MKRILCIALVLILLFVLTGCGENEVQFVDGAPAPLLIIENYDCLCYDADTKIVYIIFKNYGGYKGYGFMSPYYAPNGLPYRYDSENQELVMIG